MDVMKASPGKATGGHCNDRPAEKRRRADSARRPGPARLRARCPIGSLVRPRVHPGNQRPRRPARRTPGRRLLRHDLVVARLGFIGVDDGLGADLEFPLCLLQLFERGLLCSLECNQLVPRGKPVEVRGRHPEREILGRLLQRQVGRVLSGLVERDGVARAEDFTEIAFAGEAASGQILAFRVTGHDGTRVIAELAA